MNGPPPPHCCPALPALLAVAMTGCQQPRTPPVTIAYVGSSTVAVFLRDAEPVYKAATFELDTSPESAGGERAIVEGRTLFAGIASKPRPATLRAGIAAAQIGRDAIAVVVNARNPVTTLSTAQLRSIFTGTVTSWQQIGGPDLPVEPFIVGPRSATREVFRNAVLDGARYAGCTEITPDSAMLAAVAGSPGGVGQISFSFLNGSRGATGVRPVAVDGELPDVANFDYPIARPLYLLWREGNAPIEAFVEWTQTADGQRVVMNHFVGIRVVGDIGPARREVLTGSLIVYTEKFPVYDGGIYYYPHRPYEVLTRHGRFIRRVRNHRGENDQTPMTVDLPPETYLVRAKPSRGDPLEFFVTIEAGRVTRSGCGRDRRCILDDRDDLDPVESLHDPAGRLHAGEKQRVIFD